MGQSIGQSAGQSIGHCTKPLQAAQKRRGTNWLPAEFLGLVPVVNLSPVICVNHTDNQLTVIHCVDNAVAANTQPEKPLMPFQWFNVGAVGQLFYCRNYPNTVILGKPVDEFLGFLLDDDFIHH